MTPPAQPELRAALEKAHDMLCKQEEALRSLGADEPDAESAILTVRALLSNSEVSHTEPTDLDRAWAWACKHGLELRALPTGVCRARHVGLEILEFADTPNAAVLAAWRAAERSEKEKL